MERIGQQYYKGGEKVKWGAPLPKNLSYAIKCMRLAAEHGEILSWSFLAKYYLEEGAADAGKKAVECYEKAAGSDFYNPYNEIIALYEEGKYLERDEAQIEKYRILSENYIKKTEEK